MRQVGSLDFRGRLRVQTVNDDPSETIVSDAHLADINVIMRDFAEDGWKMLDQAELVYSDVSEFTDLQDAMIQARFAEVEFLKLPSKVREIFEHDVAVWLDTAHDKEKRDALVEAGFLERVEEVIQEEPVAGSAPGSGGSKATPEGDADASGAGTAAGAE